MKRLKQLAKLNAIVFGLSDFYSDESMLESIKYVTLLDNSKVIGYYIYSEDENSIQGERCGIHPDYRGYGHGIKLIRKMLTVARKKNKEYRTYIRLSNYGSICSHVKAGMRIYHHDSEWVYVSRG